MTVPAVVPDIVPLAVWDVHEENWPGPLWRERCDWAQEHFPNRAEDVYRAEFYLADTPFVILFQYAEDEQGRRFYDPVTDDAAAREPVTLILGELPPAHLLGHGGNPA